MRVRKFKILEHPEGLGLGLVDRLLDSGDHFEGEECRIRFDVRVADVTVTVEGEEGYRDEYVY